MIRRQVWMYLLACGLGLACASTTAAGPDDALPEISDVDGGEGFPGGEAAREHLQRHGFAVLPRQHRQMFSLYVDGDLPYYVTADSAHRTYSVLYEEVLTVVERRAASVWGAHLRRLLAALQSLPVARGTIAADGNVLAVSCVAVAARLLGEKVDLRDEIERLVAAEVAAIQSAQATATSVIRGVVEDYQQYVPRGLYAGDTQLEAYFRARQWLGRCAFRVHDARETMAAWMIVRAISRDWVLRKAFRAYASLFGWLLGPPDDLTPQEYQRALSGLSYPSQLTEAMNRLEKLREPEINDQLLVPGAWEAFRKQSKGLRLFPRRRTADTWLAQSLAEERPTQLVGGLEVAAALGSDRATAHLRASPAGIKRAAAAIARQDAMQERLAKTQYGAALRAAALLFDRDAPARRRGPHVEGASGTPIVQPAWMRGDAWGDRLLSAGLSHWVTLRHAWVLHTKTNSIAAGLTSDPAGVVEPLPTYYRALAGLARRLRNRLYAVKLLRVEVDSRLMVWEDVDRMRGTRRASENRVGWLLFEFAEMMDTLAQIADRHLAGKALDEDQVAFIRGYGALSSELQFFDRVYDIPWQLGHVVDLGADPRRGVHRLGAVGSPMELYVVLPLRGGGHRLYRGGVYSYYEFEAPRPMTDAAWRVRIRQRTTPSRPTWTRSYISSPSASEVVADLRAGRSPSALREVDDPSVFHALLTRLSSAPLTNRREDGHLVFVAKALRSYARGARRVAVRHALRDRLCQAAAAPIGGRAERLDEFLGAGAGILGELLRAGETAAIVQRVSAPPIGDVRAVMGDVLLHIQSDLVVEAATALLRDADPTVRGWGIRVGLDRHLYDVWDAAARAPTALLVAHLARETVPANQAAILEHLAYVGAREGAPPVLKAGIPAAASVLDAEQHELRSAAAEFLGVARARGEVGRLLVRLRPDVERHDGVRQRLAAALGRVLHGVRVPTAEVPQASIDAALQLLVAGTRDDEWHFAVACLKGLAAWRSPAARSALCGVISDSGGDPGLRGVAIRESSKAGVEMLPCLFRFVRAESDPGTDLGSLDSKPCFEAMGAIHVLTGGKLGWPSWRPIRHISRATRIRLLEAVRVEARR